MWVALGYSSGASSEAQAADLPETLSDVPDSETLKPAETLSPYLVETTESARIVEAELDTDERKDLTETQKKTNMPPTKLMDMALSEMQSPGADLKEAPSDALNDSYFGPNACVSRKTSKEGECSKGGCKNKTQGVGVQRYADASSSSTAPSDEVLPDEVPSRGSGVMTASSSSTDLEGETFTEKAAVSAASSGTSTSSAFQAVPIVALASTRVTESPFADEKPTDDEETKDGDHTKDGEETKDGDHAKDGKETKDGDHAKDGEETKDGDHAKDGEETKARPKANYPIRRRGEAAASSDNGDHAKDGEETKNGSEDGGGANGMYSEGGLVSGLYISPGRWVLGLLGIATSVEVGPFVESGQSYDINRSGTLSVGACSGASPGGPYAEAWVEKEWFIWKKPEGGTPEGSENANGESAPGNQNAIQNGEANSASVTENSDVSACGENNVLINDIPPFEEEEIPTLQAMVSGVGLIPASSSAQASSGSATSSSSSTTANGSLSSSSSSSSSFRRPSPSASSSKGRGKSRPASSSTGASGSSSSSAPPGSLSGGPLRPGQKRKLKTKKRAENGEDLEEDETIQEASETGGGSGDEGNDPSLRWGMSLGFDLFGPYLGFWSIGAKTY